MIEGLKPLRRNWVHMYDSFELALERSRRRRGCPVVLVIDGGALASRGILYRAGRHVYVARHVEWRYVKRVVEN